MLLSRVLSSLELCEGDLKSAVKSVTVLAAMQMVHCAWANVDEETIRNYFVKAGFAMIQQDDNDGDAVKDEELDHHEDDEEFPDILSGCGISPEDFKEYMLVDEHKDCYGDMTEDIAKQLVPTPQHDSKDDNEDEEEEQQEEDMPTPKETEKAFHTIRQCIHCYMLHAFPTFRKYRTRF